MKRILLACCLLALTGGAATAQTAKSVAPAGQTTANVDPKLMFSSKINELDASLTRKNEKVAGDVAQELLVLMTNRMNQNEDSKSATAQQQQKLYAQAKTLSAKPLQNHRALIETLHEFLQTY